MITEEQMLLLLDDVEFNKLLQQRYFDSSNNISVDDLIKQYIFKKEMQEIINEKEETEKK